ncbi:MAG TPA: hypothetical protein VGJ91_06135, partial [Polyangiaceae bacterium]
MRRFARHGAVFGALFVWSLSAQAQTPDKPKAPAPVAAETAAAAPAQPARVDSIDTRGSAMRAYQLALDKQKLAASAPLSLSRIRDELATIEEKIWSG